MTSWLELRQAWLNGHFAPGWAPMANFGLGDPHLVLYPPVSFVLGGVLSLVSPLAAPAVLVWLALLLAGVAMYAACEPFVAQEDRLAAAVLYLLSPWLITSALVRFAAADLLVQAWLPMVLLQFYRVLWERSQRATLLLGALLGLSWCTNIPESLVLLYGLLTVAAMCAWKQRAWSPVMRFAAAEGLAGVLAVFYLLPLWFERGWINQAGLMRSDPLQLLLFMHQAIVGQQKVFKYSCWIFALAGFALVVWCMAKRAEGDKATRTWGYLAAVSLVFQLPLAIPLWRYLPQLRAAEFPFRFLPLTGVALPLVLLARGTPRSLRRPVYALIGLMTLLPFYQHIRVQMTSSTRMQPFAEQRAVWESAGYRGLEEFWPVGVNALAKTSPLTPLLSGETITTWCTAADCVVPVGIYGYPYWHASDETGRGLATKNDSDGVLTVVAPAVRHQVRLRFSVASKLRWASAGISLTGILAVAFWLVRDRKRIHVQRATSA